MPKMIVNALAASGPSGWAEDLVKAVPKVKNNELFEEEPVAEEEPIAYEEVSLNQLPSDQQQSFEDELNFP